MNRDSHGRARKVKSSLTGDVGKTQRVGRRRHEHRGFELEQILHALLAAHGAARDAQRAEPLGATEGGPEAKERTKGESQEDTVCPRNGGGAVYVVGPDPRAPLPRFGGIEPAQRMPAARTGGLMEPHIAFLGIGEIRTERRRRGLVGNKIRLRGQRQTFEIVPAADIVEPRPPERVGREHVAEPGAQLRELRRPQLVVTNPGSLGLQSRAHCQGSRSLQRARLR